MKLKKVLFLGPVSFCIYLAVAAVLMIFGTPGDQSSNLNSLTFDELLIDYSQIPPLLQYRARDGQALQYRHYPARSDKAVILIHGSGWHSRYLFPLASFIASQNLAAVYTPDLRGHGTKPKKRGDVDYIGQLEDDLADFIAIVRRHNANASIILGGHSSGGGLTVRFAGSSYGKQVHAYMLFAPFLKYNAPTTRTKSGGWAIPYTGRIIGLSMLNNIGLTWFNHLQVIDFNMPETYRDGTETLSYSHRLNTSYAPGNYEEDLKSITQPLLVAAGTADRGFIAEQYQPTVSKYTKASVKVLPGVSHMGIVVGKEVRPVVKEWLKSLESSK